MLLGLDPLLTPDLRHALAASGHGDRILMVDANFPAASTARRLALVPGVDAAAVLRAVLSVLLIDTFVPDPAHVMAVVGDPDAVPPAVADFTRLLAKAGAPPPGKLERYAFDAATRDAFAVVQTGKRRLYGNVLLRKGVVA